MTKQHVIQFEYQQNLAYSSDRPGWSEEYSISVRIMSEAITSGWYAERFGKRGTDFVALLAIVMHSRPLIGDDLDLLIRLGLATREDEGRLYSRITDKGLAAELGIDRDTASACANRLSLGKFIKVASLPDGASLHDSRGHFSGSKVYLVSGELQSLLQKGIEHRAENFRTVHDLTADRAETFRTVNGDSKLHRAETFGNMGESFRTNIEVKDSADGEDNGSAAAPQSPEEIFAFFAQCKGTANYTPSQKEITALDALLLDGFSSEQIIQAIKIAFSRPSKPRYFTLCANIARDLARNPQPETREMDARQSVIPSQPEAREPEACQVDPDLAQAAEIYASTGRKITEDVLARLRRMSQRCHQAAQANGESGALWVVNALEISLGNANPKSLLNYADTVIRGWQKTGGRNSHNAKQPDENDDALPPEILVFQEATKRLPLRDQRSLVIRVIQENSFTADDLRPFWEAHIARDKKRSDLTWLLDWTVKGTIPNAAGGDRPSGLDRMAQTLQILAQKGE